MEKGKMKKSTSDWESYWKTRNLNPLKRRNKLTTYQIPVYNSIKDIIKQKKIKNLLSAGSGHDIISYNLQKKNKNSLDITILDISNEVLELNKTLFNRENLKAKFVKADMFKMPFKDNSFDLVFNTGVLEHFPKKDQIKMVKETIRVLKPEGYFVTANPSDNGKIYKLGMKIAKEKNKWPFGDEIPIKSLNFLKQDISEIESITEYQRDFLTQLDFLSYINKLFKIITIPIKRISLFLRIQILYDWLFSKFFGTYLLISVIKKKTN